MYLGENGDLVVQGPLVDGATFGELENVLPGEGAVRVPADVIIGAMRQYRDTGRG